jgi:hypothetical protein
MRLVRLFLPFLIMLVTLAYYAQGKSDSSVAKELLGSSESSCAHWALLIAGDRADLNLHRA